MLISAATHSGKTYIVERYEKCLDGDWFTFNLLGFPFRDFKLSKLDEPGRLAFRHCAIFANTALLRLVDTPNAFVFSAILFKPDASFSVSEQEIRAHYPSRVMEDQKYKRTSYPLEKVLEWSSREREQSQYKSQEELIEAFSLTRRSKTLQHDTDAWWNYHFKYLTGLDLRIDRDDWLKTLDDMSFLNKGRGANPLDSLINGKGLNREVSS